MRSQNTRLFSISLVIAVALCLLATAVSLQAADDVRVLVGFKGIPDAAVIHQAGGKVNRAFRSIPVLAVSVPAQALTGLQNNPNVKYVEPDREVQAVSISAAAITYTDTIPWGISKIKAPDVWNSTTPNTGSGIKVAVLDTGIDSSHPDLSGNYHGGYDFVDGDSVPDDENGHGTHVSGTIAALQNNAGVVGVGPNIDLYSLKFLDITGSGYTSDEIAGVEWAMSNQINVLNMSFGSYSASQSEQEVMNNAYAGGMLLVAAAGNDGNTKKLYPAAYDSVIAVAATDSNNNIASFSSYYPEVELAAPGVDIYSTMPRYFVFLNFYGYGSDYDYLSGTSMATPHVSGAAALVFASDKTLTNVQVRNRLDSTTTDLGPAGRDSKFGYGLINVLAACNSSTPPTDTGTISGTVYQKGVPVSGAAVALLNQLGVVLRTTTTNGSGFYEFSNLTIPAIYKVRAQIGKKKTTSGQINLQSSTPVIQDLYIR